MDIYFILYLLFASGFNFIRAETSQGLAVTCQSKQESAVKFSVTSHQNSTGHLIYEVSLDRAKNAGHKPWLVEVEDDTTVCDGVEVLRTTSTITYSALAAALPPSPAPAPRPAPLRPTGYVYTPGVGYHKFHRYVKSWPDAKKICEDEGAHLAIINSEKEAELLVKISAEERVGDIMAWIGFHDRITPGVYVTVLDKPLRDTGFTRWHSELPADWGYGRTCGGVATRTGGLIDYRCEYLDRFICEYE